MSEVIHDMEADAIIPDRTLFDGRIWGDLMQNYETKEALIAEIQKTAQLFINEFDEVAEAMKDKRLDPVDRTPQEMIACTICRNG
ncbi:ClbS/DfsB family four-helix bundle protein [Sporolactobacillus terrae]|uniref:ClbS/DfsB family four-helix bundle protein n=1 Tax=Sporolactobacillus terrae TaxID=269673 RepID=UPI0012DC8009